MKCNDCIFRQPIFDTAFLNESGEPVPVYRCQVMPEFHMLTNIYCAYTLNTSRFYDDVKKLNLNYLQQLASEKIATSLEEYDCSIVLIKLDDSERDFLIKLLESSTNSLVKKRAHIISRLKTLDKDNNFKLTVSECIYLVSQIHAGGFEVVSNNTSVIFKFQSRLSCL
jgi:hypothetical protein